MPMPGRYCSTGTNSVIAPRISPSAVLASHHTAYSVSPIGSTAARPFIRIVQRLFMGVAGTVSLRDASLTRAEPERRTVGAPDRHVDPDWRAAARRLRTAPAARGRTDPEGRGTGRGAGRGAAPGG